MERDLEAAQCVMSSETSSCLMCVQIVRLHVGAVDEMERIAAIGWENLAVWREVIAEGGVLMA